LAPGPTWPSNLSSRVEVERVGLVAVAARIETLGGVEDRPDVTRHCRHHVRAPPPQQAHVVDERLHLAVGELTPADSVPARALEQRVIDVGDVLHITDAHARSLDEPHQDIERAERERVAHVS